MELSDIGSLKELITDINKGGLKFNFRFLTDNQTLNFIMHLTSGLKYLHNKRLTHGDIHLGNVLVFSKIDNSGNLVAKWTDFGLSQNCDTTKDDLLKLGWLFMDISSYTEHENLDLGDAIDQMRQKLMNGEFEELNQLIESYPIVYRMLAIE
jgi:serine/threonine protein kinase